MSVSDADSDIKQLLASFETAVSIYESPNWPKNDVKSAAEDIKTAFKLGAFVEKTVTNYPAVFLKTLGIWHETKHGRSLHYPEEFYRNFCDHLLLKFFKNKSMHESGFNIAIRMYTALLPRQRLQAVIKELIVTSASFDAILDFVAANRGEIDLESLKNQQVLDDLSREHGRGNVAEIKTQISFMLSNSNVETSLPVLIGILALNRSGGKVGKLILGSVLEKMLDRSVLSKTFWLTLFNRVKRTDLAKLCGACDDFLAHFMNFAIYLASMMEEGGARGWVANPDRTLCPEITYDNLAIIFKSLGEHNEKTRNSVLDRLRQAPHFTDPPIWEQFIFDIS